MKIEVNIEKRYAFLIIGVLILIAGGIVVYAYNTDNPSNFGHSLGEIDGITCNSGQALTRTSSGWSCVNMGSVTGYVRYSIRYEGAPSNPYYENIPGVHSACFLAGSGIEFVSTNPNSYCAVDGTPGAGWSVTARKFTSERLTCEVACIG